MTKIQDEKGGAKFYLNAQEGKEKKSRILFEKQSKV
jgi:hypothetical protein